MSRRTEQKKSERLRLMIGKTVMVDYGIGGVMRGGLSYKPNTMEREPNQGFYVGNMHLNLSEVKGVDYKFRVIKMGNGCEEATAQK